MVYCCDSARAPQAEKTILARSLSRKRDDRCAVLGHGIYDAFWPRTRTKKQLVATASGILPLTELENSISYPSTYIRVAAPTFEKRAAVVSCFPAYMFRSMAMAKSAHGPTTSELNQAIADFLREVRRSVLKKFGSNLFCLFTHSPCGCFLFVLNPVNEMVLASTRCRRIQVT